MLYEKKRKKHKKPKTGPKKGKREEIWLKNTISFTSYMCTEIRLDTKSRDSKFLNKNYFPISQNYNIILPKFRKTTFAISRFQYKLAKKN